MENAKLGKMLDNEFGILQEELVVIVDIRHVGQEMERGELSEEV